MFMVKIHVYKCFKERFQYLIRGFNFYGKATCIQKIICIYF
jgi:hypothetical protein